MASISDIEGLVLFPNTFHSDISGTFESDMDGTFKVLQSTYP